MTTVATNAEHRELSLEAYHADLTHDSSSSISLFDRSPALYYHRRITKRIPSPPPTEAQKIGAAVHTAILEPHLFDELIVVVPADVLTSDGKRAGNKFKEWASNHAGKLHLKAEDYDAHRWMIDSVWSNPAARELLGSAEYREYSVFWTDADGHQRKARFDAPLVLDNRFVDVKTTRRAGADFARAVPDFDMHRQAAWYCEAFEAMWSTWPQAVYIAVENEEPYDTSVWTLPAAAIAVGLREIEGLLRQLGECRSGRRPWVPEHYGEVRELELPGWFYQREGTST